MAAQAAPELTAAAAIVQPQIPVAAAQSAPDEGSAQLAALSDAAKTASDAVRTDAAGSTGEGAATAKGAPGGNEPAGPIDARGSQLVRAPSANGDGVSPTETGAASQTEKICSTDASGSQADDVASANGDGPSPAEMRPASQTEEARSTDTSGSQTDDAASVNGDGASPAAASAANGKEKAGLTGGRGSQPACAAAPTGDGASPAEAGAAGQKDTTGSADPRGSQAPGAAPVNGEGLPAQTAASGQKEKARPTDARGSQAAGAASANGDGASPTQADGAEAQRGEGHTLPESTAPEKTLPTHIHSVTASRSEAQRPDERSSPGFDLQAGETAPGGRPHLDGVELVNLQQPTDRLGNAAAADAPAALPPSPGAAPDAAVPVAGLAVEIAARAQAGRSRFEIRLDPPELGRIDVRLDVDRDGHVTSRLVVERAETLDALRRDAGELERALQQAGLKTSDNGLQFALRDQTQNFAGRGDGGAMPNTARPIVPEADLVPAESVPSGYGRLARSGTGIDIRV